MGGLLLLIFLVKVTTSNSTPSCSSEVVDRKIALVSNTISSEAPSISVVLVTESPPDQSMAPRSPRLLKEHARSRRTEARRCFSLFHPQSTGQNRVQQVSYCSDHDIMQGVMSIDSYRRAGHATLRCLQQHHRNLVIPFSVSLAASAKGCARNTPSAQVEMFHAESSIITIIMQCRFLAGRPIMHYRWPCSRCTMHIPGIENNAGHV